MEARIPEPFVFGPSMTADAPEKSLVPAAGSLNVAAVDEGLGAHREDYIQSVGGAATRESFREALVVAWSDELRPNQSSGCERWEPFRQE